MRSMLLVVGALVAALIPAPPAAAADPIVPLTAIERGMRCTARTVVQGTAISTFDVEVLDVVTGIDGSGPRILVRVSGDAVADSGIAAGFSGSPVFCPRGDGVVGNAGAIAATVGQYGHDVGLVTPIEEILGLPVSPPSDARRATRAERAGTRPLAAPLVVSGLATPLARALGRAGAGGRRTVRTAPAGPFAALAPQPLVPGAAMAVAYATGAVSVSAIGTVTYRDGPTVYGFGHALDNVGRRALTLADAYVFTVVGNPLPDDEHASYKLAAAGHPQGIVSNDADAGVVGTVGAAAPTVPVTVVVHDRDRDRTVRQRTDVADEVDVGEPLGRGLLPTVVPLALQQALTTAFVGAPARESGRLCMRVRIRELRRPLRFCNRYVVNGEPGDGVPTLAMPMGGDVGAALTLLDDVRFADLHVTDVRLRASVERGLRLATIRAVRGPRTVRRGQRLRLRLRVREFRGGMRTVSLPLRIPRTAPLGRHELRIAGTALDDAIGDGALELLFGFDDGSASGTGLQTRHELRRAMARAVARDDRVRARIGGVRFRAGRLAGGRLDGRGTLPIRVLPARR